MNPIQTKERIDFYNNLTRTARFTYAEYAIAVNDVIEEFIDAQMGDQVNSNPVNFQWNQKTRDNIYNLIKSSAPTVTPGTAVTNRYYTALPSTFPFPADYKTFVSLTCIIDGLTVYARPTTFNEVGVLLEDSFRHPTNLKPYYNENTAGTGMTIWRESTGTFTSASLTYIKLPTAFSIGQESQVITSGNLTNGTNYYAVEVTFYDGVTYQVGALITGTGVALIGGNGAVILVSNTSPIDLPAPTHEEICKLASAKMLASIAEYQASMAIQNEADKST